MATLEDVRGTIEELYRSYDDDNPMNIKDYVNAHDKTNYCEALLFPDGTIMDARPSHTEALIREACKMYHTTKKELFNTMPSYVGVIHYLVEYTNIVTIWYEFCIADNITDAQMESLKLLQDNGIIAHEFGISISREKSLVDLREQDKYDEIEKLDRRKMLLIGSILINNVED